MTFIQAQKQSRTATIFIWVGVIFVLMAVLFVLFWKPKQDQATILKINEKLEVLRQAEVNRIKKEEEKDAAISEFRAYISKRDSLNDKNIDKVNNELKNVRNAKKTITINNYGSADLQREYARIGRQYSNIQ